MAAGSGGINISNGGESIGNNLSSMASGIENISRKASIWPKA